MRNLKGVPRQHIYKVIRSGEVRVNGGRVKASRRLVQGDRVRIPPVRVRAQTPVRPAQGLQERLLSRILYEDEDVLAIDKPAGVAVHGGSSVRSGVVEQLRLAQDNSRLELVHRLDRETSGCLLMAKRPAVLKALQAEFRSRRVKKIYELIVSGQWPSGVRSVTARLQRYETGWGERRVRVAAAGQSARTDFEILREHHAFSWLQASLHTGRTHQIRVHAQYSGCPIVGDEKYGGLMIDGTDMLLRAMRLHIPYAGSMLRLEAPEAAEFGQFWQLHTG